MLLGISTIFIGIPIIPKLMIFNNSTYFVYYIICLLIGGVAVVSANIPMYIIIQRETPDNIRGRIFGLLETLCIGISPIGLILSGLLIEKIPVYILPILSGIAMIILTVKMASNDEIKTI